MAEATFQKSTVREYFESIVVAVILALAAVSWVIADSWVGDGDAATLAFLIVFAPAVVGVIVGAQWFRGRRKPPNAPLQPTSGVGTPRTS